MLVNIPGQVQWLGFNVSSSRKPSLISPSPSPKLKVIPYLLSSNGFLSEASVDSEGQISEHFPCCLMAHHLHGTL